MLGNHSCGIAKIGLQIGCVLFCISTIALADEHSLSFEEQLIQDVLPLHKVLSQLEEAGKQPDEVAKLERSRPAETAAWRNLKIDEFESDSAFRNRQEKARQSEATNYQEALVQWGGQLTAAKSTSAVRARQLEVLAKQNTIPALVATEAKPIAPPITLKLYPKLMLPLFDREKMSFDGVQLPGTEHQISFQNDASVLGHFSQAAIDMSIHVDDLETGKKLKEDFTSGKAGLAVWGEPWLIGRETPIVVTPARTEQIVDKDAVGKTLLEGLIVVIASANGADTNGAEGAVGQRDHMKTATIPAETRQGVRFDFRLNVVGVGIVDGDGKRIPGTYVELLGQRRSSLRFGRVNAGAQAGVKGIQSGDELLSIGGKPVQTEKECAAAISAQQKGTDFDLVYRSAADGRERKVTIVAGSPIGVDVFEIHPER